MKPIKRIIYFAFLNLTGFSMLNAQSNGLTIGDTIPKIVVEHVLNMSGPQKLSDLTKGKHYILDFFATWCHPCVEALPELNRLQSAFDDQLEILPVTYQDSGFVKLFFEKHKELGGSLNFVTDSKKLHESLIFKLLPHEVWVDNHGVIQAITDGYQVTEGNLRKFIAGEALNLPLKKDDTNLSLLKPLLINGNGGEDSSYLYRSILTPFIEGGGGNARVDRVGDSIRRIVAINLPIISLFHMAYSKFDHLRYNEKRIILKVSNKERYNKPKDMSLYFEWWKKIGYSYELDLGKAVSKEQFFKYMMEDLNRYFEVKGRVVKKSIPCLVLKRTSDNDELLRTKSKENSFAQNHKIRNMPLSHLVNYLNLYKNIDPVIDETGFAQNVDMDIDFVDIKTYPFPFEIVNNGLSKYGLILRREPREIDVLLIEDK